MGVRTTLDCTLDCILVCVSFSHWLTHIRVQHLVLGSTALESHTWSRIEPHWTATLRRQNHMKVLQSYVVQP